jgi:hypothetical protein
MTLFDVHDEPAGHDEQLVDPALDMVPAAQAIGPDAAEGQ